jgi:hypothetical protein
MARPKKDNDERSPAEAERARDEILKCMLQTKPKQQKEMVAERKPKRKPASKDA